MKVQLWWHWFAGWCVDNKTFAPYSSAWFSAFGWHGLCRCRGGIKSICKCRPQTPQLRQGNRIPPRVWLRQTPSRWPLRQMAGMGHISPAQFEAAVRLSQDHHICGGRDPRKTLIATLGRRWAYNRAMKELYRYEEPVAERMIILINNVVLGTDSIRHVQAIRKLSRHRNQGRASKEIMKWLRDALNLIHDWYGLGEKEKPNHITDLFEEEQTAPHVEYIDGSHVYGQPRREDRRNPWPESWSDWPYGRTFRYREDKEIRDFNRETAAIIARMGTGSR
jgi:hypothetical protein